MDKSVITKGTSDISCTHAGKQWESYAWVRLFSDTEGEFLSSQQKDLRTNPRERKNGSFSACTAVLLLIIGMCSFAFRYDEYFWQRDEAVPHDASKLSWAFYLTLTSCLLTIIAQAFVALEILSDKYLAVDTEED